ncbi:hypothetical protein AZE42_08249 [Rhizopogon vesiculosus]|uniref:Uncharacterized protein n=1 Tax=Rhizopogon vesiculosus TaxID=180088 RepID=A0A1J8QA21_9AGAM|nr:hypothetical protein AZE42_08249 [Rhizopogon vesiculosus]
MHLLQLITALTISLIGSLRFVGTAAGTVHIYDIASHQLLRTISMHKGMSISHLATMLKPPDLIGHISLSLNLGNFSDVKDIILVETPGGIPSAYDYPEDEFQRDYAFFAQPAANGASEASSARVAELEAEIQNHREQLGKAKGVNGVMWETVVQKVMG